MKASKIWTTPLCLFAATLLVLLAAAPAGAGVRTLDSGRTAVVGQVSCAASCTISAPAQVRMKIAGDSFWARVQAPESLPRAGKAPIRVRLGKGALAQLTGRAARVVVRVVVRVDGAKAVRSLAVVLKRQAGESSVPGSTPGKGNAPGKGSTPGKGGAGGGIVSAPITSEPPVLARPATAVDVSGVKVSWFPRDSWLRYAASGVGPNDGILTSAGATGVNSTASPCPDRPSSSDAQLPYQIDFTPKPSWYDPVSGSAGIYGQGSVAFRWAAHTIDLSATDPEIEIGSSSRAIFRFSGSGGTPYPNQRASLVSLDTAGRPTVTNGGKTFTYNLMRGTLTADGVNVFAGFYTPPDNDEFGCVSVEFTTP